LKQRLTLFVYLYFLKSKEYEKSKFISDSMQYSGNKSTYKGEKQNISPLKGFFVLYYEIPR